MISIGLAVGICAGAFLVAAIVAFPLGISYRKKIAESSIKSAEEEAKRIVTEDKNVGVFTLLNYSKNIETRISATTSYNSGGIASPICSYWSCSGSL